MEWFMLCTSAGAAQASEFPEQCIVRRRGDEDTTRLHNASDLAKDGHGIAEVFKYFGAQHARKCVCAEWEVFGLHNNTFNVWCVLLEFGDVTRVDINAD